MNHPQRQSLVLALAAVRRQAMAMRGKGIVGVDGLPADPRFDALMREIAAISARVKRGDTVASSEIVVWMRSLLDWMPTIENPLIAALGDVSRMLDQASH